MLRWALALGSTPRELLRRITLDELIEQMAYARLEPFGPAADEFRAGTVAAVVANCNRDPEQVPEPWRPADFMPGLARLDDAAAPEPLRGVELDEDEISALLDAELFGKTLH